MYGYHKNVNDTIVLHGFSILYNKKGRVLHFGSFKAGKEFGPQRVIKAGPENQQSFLQYTTINDEMVGPAIIEKPDGSMQTIDYSKKS